MNARPFSPNSKKYVSVDLIGIFFITSFGCGKRCNEPDYTFLSQQRLTQWTLRTVSNLLSH